MVFPCSLKTDEMTFYVLENFEWDRREVRGYLHSFTSPVWL